jgi:multidrug efflux pump subunit AcrB
MLGLTLADLGRQVRQAFYGEEAQRIQRGRDEVKVMVRYPAEQRRSLADIEDMRIRTATGAEVPFASVAQAKFGRGFSTIERTDRRRVINVTANIDLEVANANEIIGSLGRTILPRLVADHRGLSYELEGEQREQRDTLSGLGRGYLLTLLLIFALLAVPLGSYVQPLIIMTAIPFGLIGAVWGHVLLGYNLSMFSIIGIVALAGVVVNDSLVLVSYINRRREDGESLTASIREAGVVRFRPILLTSLTTFAGLTPLMMETSIQAQMMIPMAISLSFGVIFATAISLLMVPASYLILEDLAALLGRWWGIPPQEPAESIEPAPSAQPLRIVSDKSRDRRASGE